MALIFGSFVLYIPLSCTNSAERQLYVLHASHTFVQATIGVGTVIIVYIGVAYRGGGVLGSPNFTVVWNRHA